MTSWVQNGAGQLSVLTNGMECLHEEHNLVELPWLLHPTGIRLLNSDAAGCVIGNLVLTLLWVGVLAVGTWIRLRRDPEGGWREAATYLRFPSCCVLLPVFFLPGTADSAMLLLAGSEGTSAGHTAIGIVGLVYMLVMFALLWASCWEKAFVSTVRTLTYHPTKTGKVVEYVFGKHTWVSSSHLHTERLGVLFENYTQNPHSWITQYGRYVLVEVGQVPVVVALSVIQVSTWRGCAIKAFMISVVFLMLSVSVYIHKPFIPRVLNHLVLAANIFSTLGMLGYGVVFAMEQRDSPVLLVASVSLFTGMVLSLLRAAYDGMIYTMDLLRYNVKLEFAADKECDLDGTLLDCECDARDNTSDGVQKPVDMTELESLSDDPLDKPVSKTAAGLTQISFSDMRSTLSPRAQTSRSMGSLRSTSPPRRTSSLQRTSTLDIVISDDEDDSGASLPTSPRLNATAPAPTMHRAKTVRSVRLSPTHSPSWSPLAKPHKTPLVRSMGSPTQKRAPRRLSEGPFRPEFWFPAEGAIRQCLASMKV